MENKNYEEMLLPLSICTGSFNEMESILLVSYSGGSVVHDKKKTYMTLRSAIDWNRVEASQSGGPEKEYRESMVEELEKSLSTGKFQYTDEIIRKWVRVFPEQAKKIIKSKSKKITPEFRASVKNALKT